MYFCSLFYIIGPANANRTLTNTARPESRSERLAEGSALGWAERTLTFRLQKMRRSVINPLGSLPCRRSLGPHLSWTSWAAFKAPSAPVGGGSDLAPGCRGADSPRDYAHRLGSNAAASRQRFLLGPTALESWSDWAQGSGPGVSRSDRTSSILL